MLQLNSANCAALLPAGWRKGRIPAYELLTSDAARRAVDNLICCEKRWRDYSKLSDGATVTLAIILRLYVERSEAPPRSLVANTLAIDPEMLGRHLAELVSQDLIIVDASGEVCGAYPFVDRFTGHQVHFRPNGQVLTAMCAIDALGAGAMVKQDIEVRSNCALCQAHISIETADQGRRLVAARPESAVVQIKKVPVVDTAADSLCRGILFYCSMLHAGHARSVKPTGEGHLSVHDAFEVGRALFEQRALFNCDS